MEKIVLGDLYKAYRKAKSEAFFDRGHFSSLAFADYEQDLEHNLTKLLLVLRRGDKWASRLSFLGAHTYVPKSIENPEQKKSRDIHFATLNPIEDWKRTCAAGRNPLKANFRPVIVASVNYQIVSALWIIKVGHKLDEVLDRRLTYAHSLKRVGGKLNLDSYQLFAPYFSGYRIWRSKGLEAMRCSLEEGQSIVAVTMDVKSFYHSVSPNFVLRQSFLRRNGVQLNAEDIKFTELLLKSMATWHAASPEFQERPEGALPVGLSASKIISNVLLAEFDRVMDSHPATIHYGRYADDIFLVMHADPAVHSGEQFVKWLRQQFRKIFVLSRENGDLGLKLKLPYAMDSDIIFSSKKQKIFFLSGLHGLDLIGQIEEQIKRQSSEYRLLPELPVRETQMVDMALLATPDARLEADALRKAEAVSLRRLGFSFLLGDFESYSRDLHCEDPAWKTARGQFYGIVDRYLVTPSGFFDYFTHIIRVFGLMVACRDFSSAQQLLNSLDSVAEVLSATTSCGGVDGSSFRKALKSYYRGFLQVSLESATVSGFSISKQFMSLVRRLCGKLRRAEYHSRKAVTHAAKRLLLSDLGRRSYQDYWYNEQVEDEEDQPPLPASYSVKKTLAWVRFFRDMARRSLRAPYWPAIAFPTRPPLPWQISLSIPKALEKKGGLEKLMWAVRGGHINPKYSSYRFLQLDESSRRVWKVPSAQGLNVALALPSFKVTVDQWRQAVSGAPDHSMNRYIAVRRLINEMMSCAEKIDYIIFPELSIPYRWAVDIAARLARSGISFITGIETRGSGKEYKNDVLVSLVSNFYGKKSNICFVQSKIALSYEEAAEIREYGKKYSRASDMDECRPIYMHGEFAFGVLICSDLTAIQNRLHFQGAVDALFIVEWNKDVDTFDFLVESAAHDLHAAIIQVNNRMFGDSRMRVPFAESYLRDVVKVKGGSRDFFVCCEFDASRLRAFQARRYIPDPPKNPSKKEYKPAPIGYKRSKARRA